MSTVEVSTTIFRAGATGAFFVRLAPTVAVTVYVTRLARRALRQAVPEPELEVQATNLNLPRSMAKMRMKGVAEVAVAVMASSVEGF